MISFPASTISKDSFLEILEPYSIAISCFEDEHDPTQWIIESLMEERIWIDHQVTLKNVLPFPLKTAIVPEKNWTLENARAFPPFRVGCFYIHGTHIQEPIPEDLTPITIDAATAFGSGEHATTRGCLLLLHHLKEERLLSQVIPVSLLDMGTGSGILAIAMAKLFHQPVLALDNDPESIRVTQLNGQLNKVSDYIVPDVSEGFQNPRIKLYKPFDLIMANILCCPLLEMAKNMGHYIKPEGFIILSGLLVTQAPKIIETYGQEGFCLLKTSDTQEWSSLLLQKI